MRDEMLKRLDEIIADGIRASGGHVPTGWVAFHCDLVEERCENCAQWGAAPNRAHARCASLDDMYTHRDFCCSHFTKKEP